MSDYILRFTDPARGSFVVKPYTTNGPDTPRNTAPLDSAAVSANTSLVMLGKGLPEYGDRIQENLLHLLEHFAHKVRPAYPVQGQLWFKNENYVDPVYPSDPSMSGLYVYDTTSWINVPVSGKTGTDLDLSGFKLTSLGNPTLASDATNKGFTDATYVALVGSTMAGNLNMGGFTVTNLALPVATTDAVPKGYADDTYMSKISPILAGNLDLGGFKIVNLGAPTVGTDAVNKQFADSTYVALAGGTMTGLLTAPAVVINGPGLDMSFTPIINVPPPIAESDAATKGYVDAAVLTGVSGSYLPITGGVLTGPLTVDTAPITITNGELILDASDVSVMNADVTLDSRTTLTFLGTSFEMSGKSIDGLQLTPTLDTSAVSKWYADKLVSASIYRNRDIVTLDGATTSVSLNVNYVVGSNDLTVYLNGIKQYLSQTAATNVTYNVGSVETHGYQFVGAGAAISSDVAVTNAGTYSLALTVDGIVLPAVSFEVFTSRTFVELATDLTTALTGYATVYWDNANHGFVFVSNATGALSTITIHRPDGTQPAVDLWYVILDSSAVSVTFDRPVSGTAGSFSLNTALMMPSPTYTFDLKVGGTTYNVTVSIPSPVLTVYELRQLIAAAMVTAGTTNATIMVEQTGFVIQTHTHGPTGSVYITNDTLFSAVATILTTTHTITNTGSRSTIQSVNTGTSQFGILGDYTHVFTTGTRFVVESSTGNDGAYTVSAPSTFSAGNTTITVVETIVDATADGVVIFAQALSYEEVGTPYAASSTISFLVAPASGSVLEVTSSRSLPN